MINLSHLWTHATDDEQNEILLGNAGPVQMEKHHQICPTKSKPVKRNPAIFNPLKVRLLLYYVLCCAIHVGDSTCIWQVAKTL